MAIAVDYKSIITNAMSRTERKTAAVPQTADAFRGQIDYFNFLAGKKAGMLVAASAQAPMQLTGGPGGDKRRELPLEIETSQPNA